METSIAYFNYIDGIELSHEVVNMCSHSGDCENEVNYCMTLDDVKSELNKINQESLIKELWDYGTWDEIELKNHNDNLKRILWIAACNIFEEL